MGRGLGAVAFSVAARRSGPGETLLPTLIDFAFFRLDHHPVPLRRGRQRVLHRKLGDAWQARLRTMPISPSLKFATDGLVLGAGTVVLAADGMRRLQSMQGRESRVLALLSAACGKAVLPSVIGNIKRAAKAWSEGDDCLAYIHLAHARLPTPDDPYDAAHRLFIVDSFMKAGTSPRTVFEALRLSPQYIDAVEKSFNPDEPRVPAGGGKPSGEWTDSEETGQAGGAGASGEGARGSSLPGRMSPPPPASFLGALDTAQVAELGLYVARLASLAGGAASVFGLLFIPSSNNLRVEGEISGVPGLRYWRNRDEALLHLTYDTPDGGRRVFAAYFQGDELRDEHGRVIGRVLPDGGVLIQSAVVSPDLVKDDEPRLCPEPGPDKPGERGRDYENYVKIFVNPPPNTTPPHIGFQLPNPEDSGALVYYDDCRRTSGMMADAKGPLYAKLLTFDQPMQSVIMEWWHKAGRQIAASDGRPVRWYFAELNAALAARELFDSDKEGGRVRIEVAFLPWSRGTQQ